MSPTQSDCTNLSKTYRGTKLTFEQDIEFRQENFKRDRVYRIYPPRISKEHKQIKDPSFRIDAFRMRKNLTVSNLPLAEHARMQRYNISCYPDYYREMARSPKYIFDAYHFNFTYENKIMSKTHYYSIAPTLDNTSGKTLPIIYRFSICRELGNPEHFTLSLYAVIGGYEDGFYFISRLDNDSPKFAHKIKQPKIKSTKCKKVAHPHFDNERESKTIEFPHIHRPHFNINELDEREFSRPIHMEKLKGKSFEQCLSAFLKIYNISPEMILVKENCLIDDVLEMAKSQNSEENAKPYCMDNFHKTNLMDYINYHDCNIYEYKKQIDLPKQRCGTPYLKY